MFELELNMQKKEMISRYKKETLNYVLATILCVSTATGYILCLTYSDNSEFVDIHFAQNSDHVE